MKQIWYLTGGIGSGKSLVVRRLMAGRGSRFDHFSADTASMIVREKRSMEISKAFGTGSAPALRDIVFGDPVKRKMLEDIVVPGVHELLAEALAKQTKPIMLVEMPILRERPEHANAIITVEAPVEIRIKRMLQREIDRRPLSDHPLTDEMCCKMIAAQPTWEDRRELADIIINNDEDDYHLNCQLDVLLGMLHLWSNSKSVY